jgi:murein DD-endopeptidase MepM/ murein hydrolase activator NlpD
MGYNPFSHSKPAQAGKLTGLIAEVYQAFATIPDSRHSPRRRYPLTALLTLALVVGSLLPCPALATTTAINSLITTATTEQTPTEPTHSQPPPLIRLPTISYFPETGHYLNGKFRNFWLTNGGLFQFGYPLTEEFQESNPADGKIYTVQYFERARFELHPELSGTPFEVELGLLGLQATTGRTFPTIPAFSSSPQRYYFPQTGHSLSLGFKRYWDTHGGLAIFGYPISEEISEGGYTVQYFERNRFEYHPENSGTPYEVLLGLLGSLALEKQGRTLPQTYQLVVDPGRVVQGRTLAISLNGTDNPASLKGQLNGVTLNFGAGGGGKGRMVAFAPVASDAPLKPQLLQVEVTDNSGIIRRFEQNVDILAGKFEEQTIQLDPTVEAGLGSQQEQQRERERDFGFYAQVTPEKLWQGRFSWPVNGPITTAFGTRRNYVDGGFEIHDGIDLGVPEGTPVRAPARGRVVLSELQKVRGNIIILDHGLGLHSAYFHQSRLLVKVGDLVNQGDIIGLVGTTGLSTGAHLHWEMRLGATGIDPQEWLTRAFL